MHMDSPDNGSVDAGATLSASLSVSSLSSLSSLSALSASPASDRYILTHVGQQQLLFPSEWVAEILLVDRSQILVLPFYDPSFLGIVHYPGQMILLVAIGQILAEATVMRETLSVVQLSAAADRLAGVGIVVDRASDHQLRDQISPALFDPDLATAAPDDQSRQPQPVQIFHPGLLPDRLWQPQRWRQFDSL